MANRKGKKVEKKVNESKKKLNHLHELAFSQLDKRPLTGKDEIRRGYRLYKFDEAPAYLQDNIYVLGGFRVDLPFKTCLRSVFHLHNEISNIWTHIFGFFLTCYLFYYGYYNILPLKNLIPVRGYDETDGSEFFSVSSLDLFAFTLIIVGHLFQMYASFTFHWFGCMSQEKYRFCASVDYAGVVVSIALGFYFVCYYVLWCHTFLSIMYNIAMLIIGTLGLIFVLHPHFQIPQYQSLRGATFLCLGWFGLFPI